MSKASKILDRAIENNHIQQTYEHASHSLCPETWDKFCDALNELCEMRGMDNSFMGLNAIPRTWPIRNGSETPAALTPPTQQQEKA